MVLGIEGVIWYLILIDVLFANYIAWFASKWYKKNFKKLSRNLPLTKGWSAYYLILVLWVGYGLYRLSMLS
jgi:hypothetical protein